MSIYNNGAKRSMTEGPLSSPEVFLKYPLKRICFITVKDNTQKSRWCSIGKVNDWIRRYSTTYNIVRGTEGGSHFHILAGLKEHVTLKFQKGIHFYVKCLKTHNMFTREDVAWAREGRDLHDQIVDSRKQITQHNLTISQQETLALLCTAVHKHFSKVVQRSNRIKSKTKKLRDIESILTYLQKNLDEPREDDTRPYYDYVIKD